MRTLAVTVGTGQIAFHDLVEHALLGSRHHEVGHASGFHNASAVVEVHDVVRVSARAVGARRFLQSTNEHHGPTRVRLLRLTLVRAFAVTVGADQVALRDFSKDSGARDPRREHGYAAHDGVRLVGARTVIEVHDVRREPVPAVEARILLQRVDPLPAELVGTDLRLGVAYPLFRGALLPRSVTPLSFFRSQLGTLGALLGVVHSSKRRVIPVPPIPSACWAQITFRLFFASEHLSLAILSTHLTVRCQTSRG